tara:strand:+ start:1103 stop:1300 length:198 start_codon:yes stop_codon:yes gene_type:complete
MVMTNQINKRNDMAKTNEELMEMQIVQNEAIEILIAKIEDLEKRFEALQSACGNDNIRINKLEGE